MTSPFAACDCGLSMRRCKICVNGKRKPWRCCSAAALRLHGGGIELAAVVDVEGSGPAGRETLLDQRVELPREKMKRHVAAAIGVEQDQIVEFAVAVEEDPSIAGVVAHALGLAQAEIGLGGGDHAGID